mgnify:CR=1 FL=1
MYISEIDFNYSQSNGATQSYEVGLDKCTEIFEHLSHHVGDLWYYDVLFENGDRIRIFNPSIVKYKNQ